MKAFACAAALAFAASLHAQDLAPELVPLAAKYKADTAALNAQKDEAIAKVAQVYGAALDAAEKTETTAGRLATISAITQERADLAKNELKAEFPSDLPKELHTSRKAYSDAVGHITADFGQRQQRIAADYLRTLSSFQTRTGNNPALAKQVAEEKERVLETADARVSSLFGNWRLMVAGAGHIDVTIKSNKTFSKTDGQRPGMWSVKDGYLILHWDDGYDNRISLSSTGNSRKGDELGPGGKTWLPKITATKNPMKIMEILSRHPCRFIELPILALAFAARLHAQDFAPELLPLAAKYQTDLAALDGQKATEIAHVAQTYLAALDAAEKMETTAGHVVAIAAITRERADLTKGAVDASSPKDLPKGLQTARKTYFAGVARVAADFGQRRERIKADYLRSLAALQARIGNNPAVAAQIAAEKEKALAGAGGDASPPTNPRAFVGTWTLSASTGYTSSRAFKADGTVSVESYIWRWKVENNQLKVEDGSGLWDHFDLPVREGKLTGVNNKGDTLTLTKSKSR